MNLICSSFILGIIASFSWPAISLSNPEYLEYDNYMNIHNSTTRSLPIHPSQYLDEHGYVYPWFTKPFLDILRTWDIKEWDIFEWGSGYSTVWFALHCKSITSVESSKRWTTAISEYLEQLNLKNATIKLRESGFPKNTAFLFNLCAGGEDSPYVLAIEENNRLYDCIIIDGIHRNACTEHILSHLKPGGILIVDNVDQASIGINSSSLHTLLQNYEHHSFLQPNYPQFPDWRTDYWIIR